MTIHASQKNHDCITCINLFLHYKHQLVFALHALFHSLHIIKMNLRLYSCNNIAITGSSNLFISQKVSQPNSATRRSWNYGRRSAYSYPNHLFLGLTPICVFFFFFSNLYKQKAHLIIQHTFTPQRETPFFLRSKRHTF